jgi:Mrp family chromosome partitioning ATPase
MTLSPLTVPFDIVVVDPDLLWRVDAMNGFRHAMVKDEVTVLGACDQLTAGHPAVVVLGPNASIESLDQLPVLRSGFPEVRVLAVADEPDPKARLAFDRTVPAGTAVEGIVAAAEEELAAARGALEDGTDSHRGRPRLVVVTAAKAGEGATTVAINLAAAAARAGARTVIIDGDPVFGDAALMLGLPIAATGTRTHAETGLRLIVTPAPERPFDPTDDADLGEAIGAVTAGTSPRTAADLVIVDAPAPLVQRTGLAAVADQVLIVCAARLSGVKNARVLIDALPVVPLGVVLNRADHSRLPEQTVAQMLGADVVAELPLTDDLEPRRFDTVPGLVPERSAYARSLGTLAAAILQR